MIAAALGITSPVDVFALLVIVGLVYVILAMALPSEDDDD